MEIRVPHLAEGVESGTVVSVLVAEGDQVQKDQTVVELETNKAVATIPATTAGTVTKVYVKEGDSVPVGGLLVAVEDKAGGTSQASPVQQVPAKGPTASAVAAGVAPVAPVSVVPGTGGYVPPPPSGFSPPASPSVRKMAREFGIDLTRVRGTEDGGRIAMADLRNYIQYLQQAAFAAQPAAGTAAPAQQGTAKPAAPSVDFSKWGPVHKKPLTQLRKTIAQAMVESWNAIPHVTQFDDLDITQLMALNKKHADAYKKKGAHLTVTSFVMKAVADVLKKNPDFNASLDEASNEVVYKDYYHIGIAVDSDAGLMVPVLRDANKKSLFEISQQVVELAQKVRSRKIAVEEMKGGTFTISNQGGIGGKHFTPIVNRPEVAILGLGRAYKAPVVREDRTEVALLMPIGLSYDHRVIDGAKAAKFVVDLAEALQKFSDQDVLLK